jgi:hypothetical protein
MQAGQSPSISSDSSIGTYCSPHRAQVATISREFWPATLISIAQVKEELVAQRFYNFSLIFLRAMRIAKSIVLSDAPSARMK